ncbi:MAG: hypothetical protein NXI07_12320, partial [bacterium]|nr:hypothetical protein [bacterium]
MEQVYLDHHATTRPCAACVEAVSRALTEHWANPSSVHRMGQQAAHALEPYSALFELGLGDSVFARDAGFAAAVLRVDLAAERAALFWARLRLVLQVLGRVDRCRRWGAG